MFFAYKFNSLKEKGRKKYASRKLFVHEESSQQAIWKTRSPSSRVTVTTVRLG